MDYFIIGNSIPSNISNESWVSFLGSYLSAIITGIATFIAFYFTLSQTDEINQEQHRQNIMPFLDVYIDSADVNYENDGYVIDTEEKVLRVMKMTNKTELYCGKQVYPFLESSDKKIIHNEIIYPNIDEGFLKNKSVGIQIKKIKITNIGLNAAVIINVFINDICQWKFNLSKDQYFEFLMIIDKGFDGKQINIKTRFEDLIGHQYEQKCYFISTPEGYNGELYEKSLTSAPAYCGKANRTKKKDE